MKICKFWYLLLLLPLLILGGCKNETSKKAPAPLTKAEAIKIAGKSFKSGQVIQSLKLSSDTSSQVVIANTIFGGERATFHINNQISSEGKTRHSEIWVNSNHLYMNGSSTWYKADLEKMTGHTYADVVAAIYNNPILTDPGQINYKFSKKKTLYTLTGKTTNAKLIKSFINSIASSLPQSTNQADVLSRIQKYSKNSALTVELSIRNRKLVGANFFVNAKFGKLMKVRWGQSFGNFGSHDFLKVPTNVLAAKPLPTTKSTKKN